MVRPYRWTITRRDHPDRSQQAATLRVDDNPEGAIRTGRSKPRPYEWTITPEGEQVDGNPGGKWDGYPEMGEEKRTIKQPDKAKKQISYEN